MQIVLIDNYDSFTWNLSDYLTQCGARVLVRRNDAISVDEIQALAPAGLVISPGPGRPEEAGITMSAIARLHASLPILGICLGYQALGAFFGAKVVHSPMPVHGKTSEISHTGDGLFADIPQPTAVMRYHSLNIAHVPSCLRITAQTTDTAEPMALKHEHLPLAGVQFHPESVLTPAGKQMLRNWIITLQSGRN